MAVTSVAGSGRWRVTSAAPRSGCGRASTLVIRSTAWSVSARCRPSSSRRRARRASSSAYRASPSPDGPAHPGVPPPHRLRRVRSPHPSATAVRERQHRMLPGVLDLRGPFSTRVFQKRNAGENLGRAGPDARRAHGQRTVPPAQAGREQPRRRGPGHAARGPGHRRGLQVYSCLNSWDSTFGPVNTQVDPFLAMLAEFLHNSGALRIAAVRRQRHVLTLRKVSAGLAVFNLSAAPLRQHTHKLVYRCFLSETFPHEISL